MSEPDTIHLKHDLLDLTLDQSDEDTGPVDEDAYNRTRMRILESVRQKLNEQHYSRGDLQAGDDLQDKVLPLVRQHLWNRMNLNTLPRLLEQQARGWQIYQASDGNLLVGDYMELEDEELYYEGEYNPWVRGVSSTGGTVWTNTITQERRYQENQPGVRNPEEDEEVSKRRAQKKDEKKKQREEERQRREAEEAERLKQPPKVFWDNKETQAAIDDFFPGMGYTAEDVAKLVGALPGSEVYLRTDTKRWGRDAGTKSIHIFVDGPQYKDCGRTLYIDRDGNLVMSNDMFFLKKKYRGSGMGLAQLSAQIQACVDAGVDRIETCAGRGGIMNGYYTWPRLGYDRNLAEIKDEGWHWNPWTKFPDAETVLDLMETPEGREWWKKYGAMTGMSLDLNAGSRSIETMNAYMEEKGKDVRINQREGEVAQELKEHRKNARFGKPPEKRPIPQAKYDEMMGEFKRAVWPKWHAHAELIGLSAEDIYQRATSLMEKPLELTEESLGQFKADIDRYRWHAVNDLLHERIAGWVKSPEMQDLRDEYRPQIEAAGLTWEGGLAYASGSLVPHADPREAVKAAFESVLNPETRRELKRQTYHLPRSQVIGMLDDHNEKLREQHAPDFERVGLNFYTVLNRAIDIANDRGFALTMPTEHQIELHKAAVDNAMSEALRQVRLVDTRRRENRGHLIVQAQAQRPAVHYEGEWIPDGTSYRGTPRWLNSTTGRRYYGDKPPESRAPNQAEPANDDEQARKTTARKLLATNATEKSTAKITPESIASLQQHLASEPGQMVKALEKALSLIEEKEELLAETDIDEDEEKFLTTSHAHLGGVLHHILSPAMEKMPGLPPERLSGKNLKRAFTVNPEALKRGLGRLVASKLAHRAGAANGRAVLIASDGVKPGDFENLLQYLDSADVELATEDDIDAAQYGRPPAAHYGNTGGTWVPWTIQSGPNKGKAAWMHEKSGRVLTRKPGA